jgi:hypothetical protein
MQLHLVYGERRETHAHEHEFSRKTQSTRRAVPPVPRLPQAQRKLKTRSRFEAGTIGLIPASITLVAWSWGEGRLARGSI